MIKVTKEIHLSEFEAWNGGKDTLDVLTPEEINTLQHIIIDLFPDGLSETQLNDFLWFEREYIAELLGYDSEEELF